MTRKTIVIARAGKDGDELADAITAKGYVPLIEPVLSVEFTGNGIPDVSDGTPLIFTSAHGVQAFAAKSECRSHPVYTVGDNTAEEALKAGFNNVKSASGTADDLVEMLVTELKAGLISPLYIRAEHISKDLRQILAQRDVFIQEVIGYMAKPGENLSINLLKSADSRDIEAIMFFSSRGAATFTALIEQYDRIGRMRGIKALCISDAVVKSVSVLPFEQTLVADTPDRYGMIKLLDHVPAPDLKKPRID